MLSNLFKVIEAQSDRSRIYLFIYLFIFTFLNKSRVFNRIFIYFFSFIFISWRLITLQYCSSFLSYIDMNQPWIYMYSLYQLKKKKEVGFKSRSLWIQV